LQDARGNNSRKVTKIFPYNSKPRAIFLEIRDIIATNWAKRGQKRQAGMGDTFDKPAGAKGLNADP